MSPSDPPIRISEPSARRYAFETHCCAGNPPPRSRSIAGSATLTIEPSIAATPEPRIAATNVNRWRRLICSDEAPDERERDVGDLTPAVVDHKRVPPSLDLDDLRHCRVSLLELVRRPGDRRG